MLLNRRTMLQAGVAAVALSLTGCKKTVTTVIFINASNSADNPGPTATISVAFTSDNGQTFNKNNIQAGHQFTKTYRTNDTSGNTEGFNGTVTVSPDANGVSPVSVAGTITLGTLNIFTFDGFEVLATGGASIDDGGDGGEIDN